MTDTPSRIIGLACVLLGVWVVTYWLYQPSPRVTLGLSPTAIVASKPTIDPAPLRVEPTPPDPSVVPQPSPKPLRTRRVQKLIEPQFREYTVQKGDTTFDKIAARREVYSDARRSSAIARFNPWADPTKLKPGITVLKIPLDPDNIQGKLVWVDEPVPDDASPVAPPTSDPVPTPAAPPVKTYTIRDRDTLSDISKKFYGRAGLWKLIADANKDVISNPDRLPEGAVIKIPAAPSN